MEPEIPMRVPASLRASWRHGWRVLAVLLLCAVAALAQAQSTDGDSGAPPDRVARLSWIAGDLGLLPAGSQDWASADLNRPLTSGDRLSTGDGARAELQQGGASLRMDGGTDFGMLNLNDNLAQVELTQGTLNLSVRNLDPGQSYEIDTPTLALVVSQPGTYRVDVDNDGTGTRVAVFNGQATVYGENNAQHDVFAGRSYQFDDPSLAALMVTDIGSGDAFDNWCNERDQQYAQAGASQQYVSADVVGYQDLDQYGSWQDSPDDGAVWYPGDVPVGWAPYRYGHWVWIAPWGWTWVDSSRWGFAPYHYGRWVFTHGRWGWIPGPRGTRPVYAPALVGFTGAHGAPVGWFPLGPGEVYNPWYRCDRACYQRVNIANIHVHDATYRSTLLGAIEQQYEFHRQGYAPQGAHYANRAVPGGFTVMPRADFANGQSVQNNMLHVDPRQFASTPVANTDMATLRPFPHGATQPTAPGTRSLPTADFRRSVVTRTPPPASLHSTQANFVPANGRAPLRTLPTVEPISRASPAYTQPKPGVSFISGPEQQPPSGTLPQVPRFERAPGYSQPRYQPAQPRPSSYQPRQQENVDPSYEPMSHGVGQPSWQPRQGIQQTQTLRPAAPSQPTRHAESPNRAPPPAKSDQH
jgi:hypothetical protein